MGTSVRLSARLERLVARVAKKRGITKSEVIRNVLAILEKEDQKACSGATPSMP
jgi:predicted DNA-binding protein